MSPLRPQPSERVSPTNPADTASDRVRNRTCSSIGRGTRRCCLAPSERRRDDCDRADEVARTLQLPSATSPSTWEVRHSWYIARRGGRERPEALLPSVPSLRRWRRRAAWGYAERANHGLGRRSRLRRRDPTRVTLQI